MDATWMKEDRLVLHPPPRFLVLIFRLPYLPLSIRRLRSAR